MSRATTKMAAVTEIILSVLAQAFISLNAWGTRLFGCLWLPQFIGPLYPGIIAHCYGKRWYSLLIGHLPTVFAKPVGTFDHFSVAHGVQDEKLREFARQNGGICTFRLAGLPVIFINNYHVSLEVCNDAFLQIPLIEELSGMPGGKMQELLNTKSRIHVLGHLMAPMSLFARIKNYDLVKDIHDFINKEVNISRFIHTITERMESDIILDLKKVPLDRYMQNPEYHEIVYNYLDEIVNFVMSSSWRRDLSRKHEEFMMMVIKDNFDSISSSGTNLFKATYDRVTSFGFPKCKKMIGTYGNEEKRALKMCLGLLAGSNVNTANQLSWVIRFIETQPEVKKKVISEARSGSLDFSNFGSILETFPYIQKVVLETIRYMPLVPTLGKTVRTSHSVKFRGQTIQMNPNTLVIVDLLECNRSAELFPHPNEFNVENVNKDMLKDGVFGYLNEPMSVRSFGGGSNLKASSRCPGRLFSMTIQALIIASLYKKYDVKTKNVSMRLHNHDSHQVHAVPENKGTIHVTPRTE